MKYTKKISTLSVPISQLGFLQHVSASSKHENRLADWEAKLQKICDYFKIPLAEQQWIPLARRDEQKVSVYYVPAINGVVPDLDTYKCKVHNSRYQLPNELKFLNYDFAGFKGRLPSLIEAQQCFNEETPYFRDKKNFKLCVGKDKVDAVAVIYSTGAYAAYRVANNNYDVCNMGSFSDWDTALLPVYTFYLRDTELRLSAANVLLIWLDNNLKPAQSFYAAPPDIQSAFTEIANMWQELYPYIKKEKDCLKIDREKLAKAMESGKTVSFVEAVDDNKAVTAVSLSVDDMEALQEQLAACDQRRIGLTRYDKRMLTDANRGHWDLWHSQEKNEDAINLDLPIPLVARNPEVDVNRAGIVGIDFGTKSTVAAFENEHGEAILLQIGDGSYRPGKSYNVYENPTIIEIVHFKPFWQAYQAKAGRPDTSWQDVCVSHKALADLACLNNGGRSAAFFSDIKQWCSGEKPGLLLCDQDGLELNFTSFGNLTEQDFDPLEIYAYYVGSFINNMLQPEHIFLKYLLSFPVTFAADIKDRICKSFARGLKKSLPIALLNNDNVMRDFQVVEGCSEATAYAVTALESYGLLRDEEIYYGVFDFGGGTTDFDFGRYSIATDNDGDRYDYVITSFGAAGDALLGGEKLLALMAFKIFQANMDKLFVSAAGKECIIPFFWAAEKVDFVGSEAVIRNSQEAAMNMNILAEALRPIWEQPNSAEAKSLLEKNYVNLSLFCEDGYVIPDVKLVLNNNGLDLQEFLANRIRQGIDNFFMSMYKAFRRHGRLTSEQGIVPFNKLKEKEFAIFLGGNSSRSVIVQSLFQSYLEPGGRAEELLDISAGNACRFILYPPLGTEEANKMQNSTSEAAQHITAKTGVACGLLKCRAGGNVKIVELDKQVSEREAAFQYYVGRRKRGKFVPVLEPGMDNGRWMHFIDADEATFDLLYTDCAIAASHDMQAAMAKRISLQITAPDTKAAVYVRPAGNNCIEYAVFDKDNYEQPRGNISGIRVVLQ